MSTTLDQIVSGATDKAVTAQHQAKEREALGPAGSKALLTFDTDNWQESSIPKRPWVAPGYLLRGAVTVVVGAPAAGKSSLMVGWAAALGLGLRYGRMQTPPRKVMTYNVEDDRDEQRRRFSGVLRYMGRTSADLRQNVIRIGTDGIGTLLTIDPNTHALIPTEAMHQMLQQIASMRPDVLILDPLVELHEAEENDNTAVRSVMAYFRSLAIRYEMAVVLLHHTRKGSSATAGDPDVARGASSVIGAARIVLTVTVMTEEEANNFGIKADHRRFFSRVDGAKINAAPIGTAEWFERESRELDNGDMVPVMVPWSPPHDMISMEQMDAIKAGIAKGSPTGPWSPKLSKDARSVKRLLSESGVSTAEGQRKVLDELMCAGFVAATFKRGDNRVKAQGLRAPDGSPGNVHWLSGEDT
ncbi:AAA family ATPase [Gluconobacter japonicus]|uniref:AAA family ATPase n=1 Tax=Gluconobacter japonicus TaxID=376620 RepID=A0ABQ5WFV4_GLUJA|nr:AAA family ATPase [Gluconobacter japonicus]KXV27997.1 hypothetical protein AD938_05730 [Gluconobacter japonicus]GBR23370.1 hypothetical protein AA3271_1499 [Gluconobacter japonicus NBRC 3271]GLQ58845.1 hypothetical protein GCM10010937_06480 [Gluconobacter japonicus]